MYVSQYLKIATFVPFCDAAPHLLNCTNIDTYQGHRFVDGSCRSGESAG